MRTPPIPRDEAFRLEVLRSLRLLDSPAEARFDRITRVAARAFGVPFARVNLVDADRVWGKSRHGGGGAETPRAVAFCSHALQSWAPLVVEDALQDGRFADNPLVAGPPHIRSYAGMPLRGPGGALVGTLCVIGLTPRAFPPADLEHLRDLAAWAELELVQPAPSGAGRGSEALEREARLKLMLGSFPDILFRQDRLGTCLEVLVRSPEDLGRPPQELMGRTVSQVLPPREAAATLKAIGEVLDTGEARTLEYCFDLRGRQEDFEARIVPCGPGQVLTIVRNISARRDQERRRDGVLRTVSHELRTPLSSIRSSLDLLLGSEEGGGLSEKAREFAELAQANAVRLGRLVDDLLAQARRGRMPVAPRRCSLASLARQAVEAVTPYSASFGVDLPLQGVQETAEVVADPDRAIQVLVNLLSNAVKYSPPGESVVTRIQPSPGGWVVEVEDHGPGIPPAFQPRVFQEFSQAGGPHQQPGSGLGLSISKTFAESMGGELTFDSHPGRTVFRLRLPAAPIPAAIAGPVPHGAILHVEDDGVVSQLLASALEGLVTVEVAGTLAEARARIAERAWEAVVLDGRLPDGPGAELLPVLREAFGPGFPVILYAGDLESPVSGESFTRVFLKGGCGPDEIRQALLEVLPPRP